MSTSWWEALNQALGLPVVQIIVTAILIPVFAYLLRRWWKSRHPPPPPESQASFNWNLNFYYIDARSVVILNPEGDPFHTPLGYPPGIAPPIADPSELLRMGTWAPGQTLGSTRPLLYFDGRVASLSRTPPEPRPPGSPSKEPDRGTPGAPTKEEYATRKNDRKNLQ